MTATPQKLGRYETLEEIGKGAMGVVYLARDPLIGRLVALKTFRVGFAARDDEMSQFRSRFVREAQSAGILSHPNIVTIHDVVDEGPAGLCFIAMEYVKGTNLKQLLQRPEPFPLGFVIEILAQVAEALDYAHSRGVIHRDVKPANILITPENRVKITDFGIARIESSNLTMEGQLLGTPNYMAPEQIQGKEVDHRADIFSLGVVFYELLTRKKPFQGENMTAVTHKIVFEPFRPPEQLVAELPKGLTPILSRCLEKDPARRYPRASEVARELRAVLAAQQTLDDTVATQEVEPIPAPPVAPPPAGESGAAGDGEPAVSEVARTRLVERPPIPPPPRPAGGPEAIGENAPTRLVARPPLPPPPSVPAPARPPQPPPRRPAAATPPPSTAATVLSAVPKGGGGPLPPPGSAPKTPATVEPERAFTPERRKRLVIAAVCALIGLIAVLGIGAWLVGEEEPDPALVEAVAPAPTPEQQSRVIAAAAIAEARTQLASGNTSAALQAVARAELAEPGNPETAALREEIESRQRELEEAEKLTQVEEGLQAARYAWAERRYADAVAAARGVLEVDPANDDATRIAADSEREIRRLRERQEAIEAAQKAALAPPPEPQPERTTPAPAAAPANDVQLRIAFASDRSEGTLTIYSGDRQILREPFRFVRRTGLLSRERVSGTIDASRRISPEDTTLRVYVALPGLATRAISIEHEFVAGTSPVLEIRVDTDGNASAFVR
jgi:serine/threonine protein kinase